ncbi:MAG: alpha-galactosidase [Pseudomonadota bacterium]
MNDDSDIVWLTAGTAVVAVDTRSRQPVIRYWGEQQGIDGAITALWQRPEAPASVHDEPALALTPQLGFGFLGLTSLQVHRDGRSAGTAAKLVSVSQDVAHAVTFTSVCDATGIVLEHALALMAESGVLTLDVTLHNRGSSVLTVDALPGLCLPIAYDWSVTGVGGRWALEFQPTTTSAYTGAWVRENRTGRTSHHTPPLVFVHATGAGESSGEVVGLHLGWSGNHRTVIESLPDGRRYASISPLFLPGEIRLAPDASIAAPRVYAARSATGYAGVSAAFHRYCRQHLLRERVYERPRPVHFNTWEALYFDVNETTLPPLIEQAAALGIERFVLDDGWFAGRNDDSAALGDWWVDPEKFPAGLKPIADLVVSRGMQFGLWLEPEMVNPDSELFRKHPDWAQHYPGTDRILARNQLVLDLSNPQVRDYLLAAIDQLLTELPITYLKWDMNRDLAQPGNPSGQTVAYAHTQTLYALLDALRAQHPDVEIESCASGGARVDYGVLARTDRIWTSDSNDALDRLTIQRGASRLIPPEIMGSHVGPFECHITGRRLSMAFRAGVAMLGHMGVEADIRELDDDDRAVLSAAIECYKTHRHWWHRSSTWQLATPPDAHGQMLIAEDARQALAVYAVVSTPRLPVPPSVQLLGLKPMARYQVTVLWRAGVDTAELPPEGEFSGAALMRIGLPLPVVKPETLLMWRITELD